jgi:dihydroorotate dehydrogenase
LQVIFARMFYQLLRRVLFCFDPERVHYFSMNALRLLCRTGLVPKATTGGAALQKNLWGLCFKNPVGLGAGFDKNARYLNELAVLGFGFVEVGTVTPLPQAGNERPRLFRLPKDGALVNRMGFNNDGAAAVAGRLRQWREKSGEKQGGLIIGGNIGKNKATPNEEAWLDYEKCFVALHPYVDYFVVNVSSPNTPGLRELQEKGALRKILTHLQQLNGQLPQPRPILLKIAPDLSDGQLDDVAQLALEIKLDGLVASNTTIAREGLQTPGAQLAAIGAGGLSGRPLRQRATDVVRYLHQKTGGQLPIVASGGIFTGADAAEKMAAGAQLVQVWTGFIYEGPAIVKQICKGLAQ